MADSALLEVLTASQGLGFLGPGDVSFHVEHAAAFGSFLTAGWRVLDLGTGGGVPGLALGVDRADLSLVLLDAQARRCAFVRDAIDTLDLAARMSVAEGRAETLARDGDLRGTFDAVMSRSFGPPAVTAECAVPFLKVGGLLLVSEPPSVAESDARWPVDGPPRLGLTDAGRQERGGFSFRVLALSTPSPDSLPRRVGVAAKRPFFVAPTS